MKQGTIASGAVTTLVAGEHSAVPAQAPLPKSDAINSLPVRVGMTDWNLGQRGDITKIALAREIGLDGIQVSLQFPTDGRRRRCASPDASRLPASRPRERHPDLLAGHRLAGQIAAAPAYQPGRGDPARRGRGSGRNIGTNNILLPILGASHIDMTNQWQVDTFIAMMKEVARYAEKCGVVVGLEDWISAEHNLMLLDAIGSDDAPSYYDAHNLVARVKDIYAEPQLLGWRINQIHVKNANLLLSNPGGKMDWPRMAEEFYAIGYRGWYVLETSSPTKDIIADTRAYIDYVKKTFRMPPASVS